jgi:hypothetical protein
MPSPARLVQAPLLACQPIFRLLRGLTLPACALLLAACATHKAPPPVVAQAEPLSAEPIVTLTAPPSGPSELEELRTLAAMQDRIDRIAAPLLLNNPELCKNQARNLLGFTAKNKYSYSEEYTEEAQALFGLDEQLQVIGVLAGSGASRAGLQRGDILLAAQDKPLPKGPNAERAAAAILSPLANNRASVKLSIARKSNTFDLTIPLSRACAFRVELGNADNVNAYADGQRVMITRGMLNFVRTDEELAFLIANGMAHNVLSHAYKLRNNVALAEIIDNLIRVHPDLSVLIGSAGLRAMPQELDAAADRLSLYMLARAKFNVSHVVEFWQKLANYYPATVLNGHTALHPSIAFRIAAMEKSVKEVRVKQASREALLP